MILEEWKVIKGYPNYEISNFGNVRSYCVWGQESYF